MSDDLISREAVVKAVDNHTREDGTLDEDISVILEEVETAFDKGKVIEKLKRWRKILLIITIVTTMKWHSEKVLHLDQRLRLSRKAGIVDEYVTAWRPLPEPYRPERSEE